MRPYLRLFGSNRNQPSLMILGHPRGLTSHMWAISTLATKLKAPTQTTSGELLNHNRNPTITKKNFFSPTDFASGEYQQQLHLHRCGYCIKDVIQPYIVLDYLKNHPGEYRVLYIHRDPAIVHWRQQLKGWNMPHPSKFVDQFKAVADEMVTFEQVTEYPDQVFAALERLGYRVRSFNYRDEKFLNKLAQQDHDWQRHVSGSAA